MSGVSFWYASCDSNIILTLKLDIMNSKKMNRKVHDGNHELAKKPSKHDANLQKNNLLPFLVGLTLSLLVAYFVLEVEVPDKQLAVAEPMDLEEPIWVTVPPVVNEVDEVKKVEVEKKAKRITDEIIIDSTPDGPLDEIFETDPEPTDIVHPDDVLVADGPPEPVDVPFILVEDVPMFPKCEDVLKDERRACFQEQMQKHIKRNFRYPELARDLGQYGKVYVYFVISKEGHITNVQIKGPHKTLEKEAARIIGKLPKMIPGKQRGTPVNVPFSIPINFQLQQ